MAQDKETTEEPKKIEESFDVTGLVLDLLSHWKWFLLSIIVCGCIAYYYVSTIIPVYNVSASIYLSDETGSKKSKDMLGINDPLNEISTAIDETEIEILKSRNSLVKIVDSLELAYSYYHVGKLRDVPVYHDSAVLVHLDSISLHNLATPIEVIIDEDGKSGYKVRVTSKHSKGGENIEKRIAKLPAKIATSQGTLTLSESPFTKKMYGTEKVVVNRPSWVAAGLAANLSIDFARNSNSILRLSLNTLVIDEGRDVLRALVDFYNEQILEDKNRSSMQTEAFILDRLVMISGELHDVENRLREYRQANNVINLDAQTSMNLSARSENENQLAMVDAEKEILNEIEKEVAHQDSYSTLPSVANNAAVASSIENYNKAVANYQHALESMGTEHPHIAELQTRLNRQKSQIMSTISAAKREVGARRSTIVRMDNRSLGQLAAQPTIDKGLNEIFREQQVKVNIYTFLLQKREEIALQKTLATPTAQFIDNPSGSGPVSPNTMSYLGIGILVGFLIPGVIIVLRRLFFPTFSDKDELQRLTKVPVLGEICLNDTNDDVVVAEGASTPIAELFRLLRNNINFIGGPAGDNKVIMVTSSISGEGKTFVALNLALTFALTGKKIIVVGLDIRRPVLARVCGISNHEGVSTYLSGQEHDLNKLIQQTKYNPNLYVLPAGPIPPNPNELLLSNNMTMMVEELRKEYDYVIIDSAPIGLVSDSFLIIPHTDVQLYVARANVSTTKGLKVLHEAINNNRLPRVYIVLNGVDVASTAYIYRRYGRYGYETKNTYGYAYGYGYGDKAKKKKK